MKVSLMIRKVGHVSLVSVVGLLGAAALGQDKAPAAAAPAGLKDNAQKAAYALGVDVARSLKESRLDGIDLEIMARGMRDALAGGKVLLSEDELKAAVPKYLQEANEKQGQDFLAANKTKAGVQTTKSGLQYKVLKSGNGPTPKASDTVKTYYRGTFIDGKVFDSAQAPGEPATFQVSGVIPGWTEALQLMKVGDKWQLFVPAKLAYGEGGNQGIPPNSVLVFEIELLGIQ